MRNVIAIVGNTGVGKSQLAVELARALNGEIINADALQLYRGLPIVTNKHPIAERHGIPHHMLGFLPWSEAHYTVQNFENDALACIAKLHDAGKLPILVGGTHYYIQSLLAEENTIGGEAELTSSQLAILDDPGRVERELARVDPVVQAKFHPNDHRRLRRALEIYYISGKPASEVYSEQQAHLRFRVLVLWIQCDRPILLERLDRRVETMVSSGLLDEMREMYTDWAGYGPTKPRHGIWQVLGFRQFLPYFEKGAELEGCVRDMQAETRQYAKRQTKWIRNKLVPAFDGLDGFTWAVLDSSDLTHWHTHVKDRALKITEAWLNEKPAGIELVPPSADVERRQQAFGPSQWIRRRCEVCSRKKGTDIWMLGDDAWEIHIQSRGHRHAARRST